MKFDELVILLPCHSLEDFPTYHTGADAEGLLAAWSALWHPALLAEMGQLPTWFRADVPPENLAGRLIVVPEASDLLLPSDWLENAAAAGARVVRGVTHRRELVAAALEGFDVDPARRDSELAQDFLALGYCYLAVELLTRQMRYMSNVDEVHLANETLAAAKAFVAGDDDETRRRLRGAFEVLREARDRFYPVDCYLVDLTLTAPTTLGASLRLEAMSDAPHNVLITGELVERLAEREPETLAALRLAVDHGRVSLAGGEWSEVEAPLLPPETVLANFARGAAAYVKHLGEAPVVYGRRRYGLTPALPQLLSRRGYVGALHFTLEEGVFPTSSQSKTRWEGLDGSSIDVLARLPLDAAQPGTFLALSRALGESMDRDHVATVVLAHWPGQASEYYADLQRMAAYAPVLGRFVTLLEYFNDTARPGDLTLFKPDRYRAPYLRQAVEREEGDPLSRIVAAHEDRARAFSQEALSAFAEMLDGKTADEGATADAAMARVAEALARSSPSDERGILAVNPQSGARRVVCDVTELASPPTVGGAIVAVDAQGERKYAVVDVPGSGFAWIGPGAPVAPPKKPAKPLAAENVLENEHLRVVVNPETGAIQSIHDRVQRYNRLSAQLAIRTPAPGLRPGDLWRDQDDEAVYSVMAIDAVDVTHAGAAWGELAVRGRMLALDGRPMGTYAQTLRLVRGSRVLVWDIAWELGEELSGDPWESYLAARFAWRDGLSLLSRGVGLSRQDTEAKRIETPDFVEVQSGDLRTTILAGGLPYHRRAGDRMLDSILAVRGETRRRIRLGIGIDLRHAAPAAVELLAPEFTARGVLRPTIESGWLFHVDAPHVVATHWEALRADESAPGGAAGFRVRFMETAGRGGRVRLRAYRDVAVAHQVDFLGQTLVELPCQGDCVTIDIAGHEWVEVECRWK